MAGISTRECVSDAIREQAGSFQNPVELWEVMKTTLRHLSVDADAEAVAGLAIVTAQDFPSFAERVVNVLVFILERESGARKAVLIVMIINKIILRGAAILGPGNPYITIVNRQLGFILRLICCHGGDVRSTFHECIKSWVLRGLYPPFFFQQVVQLESRWARIRIPMSPRPPDYGTALAENSPDVLDMVWVGIGAAL